MLHILKTEAWVKRVPLRLALIHEPDETFLRGRLGFLFFLVEIEAIFAGMAASPSTSVRCLESPSGAAIYRSVEGLARRVGADGWVRCSRCQRLPQHVHFTQPVENLVPTGESKAHFLS